MSGLDYLVLILFSLSLLVIGISKVSQTESSYLLADRRTGLFALIATLVMTELNTATLISFAASGHAAGFWGLILPSIFLIGLLFYAFTVAKKWKAFNGLSVAAFFSQRYGKDVGRFASLTLLTSMAGFSATYIKSLVILFSPFFPHLSEWTISSLLVIIPLIMTFRGGLVSVIYTDIFSFVVTFIFFPLMAFFSWQSHYLEIPSLHVILNEGSQVAPVWFITSLIILTMFTYILAPWYGQKIFAAQTEQVAYVAVLFAAFLVFFLYACAILTTIPLREANLPNPDYALPFAILRLPEGLRGLGYGILFAASATTLTGVWGAMTAMVVEDFFYRKSSNNIKRAFLITLCMAVFSYLISNLLVDRILEKLILANIPVAALSFALLGGFHWKKSSRFGAYCSIFVGLICGAGSYIYWGEEGGYTWYWTIGGIPLIFLSGIVGSYCFPQENIFEKTNKFSEQKI
jgi:Na+/proline symporter